MKEESKMDEENRYITHEFEDGQILTAEDMNNIIAGIDENIESIKDLSNELQYRVPPMPSYNGMYWLSASYPFGGYEWVKETPVSMYTDPEDDGNIVITNSETESQEIPLNQ